MLGQDSNFLDFAHVILIPMEPDQNDNYWKQEPEEVLDSNTDTQPDAASATQSPAANAETPVNWTAHEYIVMDKSGIWYVLFSLVVMGLIAIDVFLLKSWTFSALVVVMAVAVIVYARRPAREIQYTLSGAHGLYVGERLYNLADFKAFGIIRDGDHHSIMLIPTKRFSPGVSVYFPEEAGEQIVDILGKRLPMENLKLDVIDMIVRQLRL